MSKTNTIPSKIKSMIKTGYNKKMNSKQIAHRINNSATAKNMKIELSWRQVAAHMAWFTMQNQN